MEGRRTSRGAYLITLCRRAGSADEAALDLDLFESLRAWRAATGRGMSVPAYVVFPDKTAALLVHPRREEDMPR